jgi:hypothetical protein
VDRYSFTVVDFHLLFLAGLPTCPVETATQDRVQYTWRRQVLMTGQNLLKRTGVFPSTWPSAVAANWAACLIVSISLPRLQLALKATQDNAVSSSITSALMNTQSIAIEPLAGISYPKAVAIVC